MIKFTTGLLLGFILCVELIIYDQKHTYVMQNCNDGMGPTYSTLYDNIAALRNPKLGMSECDKVDILLADGPNKFSQKAIDQLELEYRTKKEKKVFCEDYNLHDDYCVN